MWAYAGQKHRVNTDLLIEREKASFDLTELTYIVDGGPQKTRRRRCIQTLALNDTDFQEKDPAFLSRDEQYTSIVRRSTLLVKKLKELNLTDMSDQDIYRQAALRMKNSIFTVHDSMVIPMLQTQADETQKRKWLPKALNYEIICSYVQTELGHGTFVRGLETTATYDPSNQEFIINSPTLTSTKWWPGYSGKSANCCILMAQLCSQGKKYGLHAFIVPLRRFDDHELLPGVKTGDIGPKLGIGSNDNGFCRFDNVRIPRENLLSKYSKIDPDGTYHPPNNDKMVYTGMVLSRIALLALSAQMLDVGCTISTRYSAVRRQTELTPGGEEPQIIDYQSQQLKLFPQLAAAYAFRFAVHDIRTRCDQIQADIKSGDISSLQELHGLSAGMKSFICLSANLGLEVLRLSCGGHGYSQASGFPAIYGVVTGTVTADGEYSVLMLQTARYLVKCVAKAASGEKLPHSIAYLTTKPESKCPAKSENDILDLETLVNAYKHRAYRLVNEAARQLTQGIQAGKPQHEAWNDSHVYLIKAADAHCHYYTVMNFVQYLQSTEMSQPLRDVLTSLCQLYALYGIESNAGDLLQDGYMSGEQISMVTNQVVALLAVIRPNAVALVDAFDIPDEMLGSILGRYDGNVYENLYKWAKESPLNQTEVHHSYHEYLKPLLTASPVDAKL
ncbi:peroxisomal acyl-coenzyme A oxidase 1-like isoform X1 [Ptychodera flava]|uniref:peroxisomal acyl-coenzyme A oxidase 1-like isoform X1 n=2 Tax=Ptychodera flava TaxID=63121 RepID=UPI00396A3F84